MALHAYKQYHGMNCIVFYSDLLKELKSVSWHGDSAETNSVSIHLHYSLYQHHCLVHILYV